jgi:4-amino-4-deoxy-L-arabinose transferase-like glycosyltransferase
MKQFFNQHFHWIFLGTFFILTGYLVLFSPLWADENVYLELARLARSTPFEPFNSMLLWVPHPPLGWYLFATFGFLPRITSILATAGCTYFLYHVSKKIYGDEIAKISVVILVSTLEYMLYSAVAHLEGLLTAAMTLSVLSFLVWIKSENKYYLLLSGLGLGLASMIKYTAMPILIGTFILWFVFVRKKINLYMFFKTFIVIVTSLVPLAIWVYYLTIFYGNFTQKYSEIYSLFPTDPFLVAVNLVSYTITTLLICGLPLFSWIRKRSFNFDAKLLLIYLSVLFTFFTVVTSKTGIIYASAFRYLLPLAPTISIISAKNLKEEKLKIRNIILISQFTYVTLFAMLMLLSPPFLSFTTDFYSKLLEIIGISI